MSDIIQITTTTDSPEKANAIAKQLVERRLAACAQISGPITSVYHWQGKIETAHEWKCTLKATRGQFNEIMRAITDLHDYELPEITATAVIVGNENYLQWVREESTAEQAGQ